MDNDNYRVSVRIPVSADYPEQCPYNPSELFSEYSGAISGSPNAVYAEVRRLLFDLGMDAGRFDTPGWNPFGEFIRPGMTVFIKPNTVSHFHPGKKNYFSVVTHASVLRPVLDYACRALENRGTIVVADSPLYSSDFRKAFERSGIAPLLRWYAPRTGVGLEWFDLRMNRARRTILYGRWDRVPVMQDPRGYTYVDLGRRSRLAGIDPSRLRTAVASFREMREHHTSCRHEYLIPNSLLRSDVVISLPKLKTHRRTAVTLCLKNYMGIPSQKGCLPHFITGSPSEGGDQYIHSSHTKRFITLLHDIIQTSPSLPVKFICAVVKKIVWDVGCRTWFRDTVSEAMWPGNDTLWRTLGDLNAIVTYADREGNLCERPQRSQLFIVDGIIGGEGDGPLAVDPVRGNALVGGFNAVATDVVAATLMGFDFTKIPLIEKSLRGCEASWTLFKGNVADITVTDNGETADLESFGISRNLRFAPHPSWKGAVEREDADFEAYRSEHGNDDISSDATRMAVNRSERKMTSFFA